MTPDKNNEKVRQDFAARFRKALKELGYSPSEQARLQRLFGVSGQAVRKWAEGLSMPSSSRLPAVAQTLGVRRAWLQDGEGPMRPTTGAGPEMTEGMSLTEREVKLIIGFRKLDPVQQDAIDQLLAAIQKR